MNPTKRHLTILALAATTAALSAADTAGIWDKTCQKCHGADGKAGTKIGKILQIRDMTNAKFQASFTDDQAFKAIKEGIKDGDKVKMKPAEGLSDDDIKALVAKVRAFKP
ncbi:MAG: cytochrome c [Verrucomicrobiota bacterium]|jgi:cytochrome c553